MNPLKTLFNKVFDTPPPSAAADALKDDGAFEWNPDQEDEEIVAPTSALATSWKRGSTLDDVPSPAPGEATPADLAASAHDLPKPTFERSPAVNAEPKAAPVRLWNEPAVPPTPRALSSTSTEGGPSASVKPATPAPPAWPLRPTPQPWNETKPVASPAPASDSWIKPILPEPLARPAASTPVATPSAPPVLPPSDFEDVYRKAGIKSPIHGYGVERVYRLLTSRRLVSLDRSVRRSALLTALDAAGVPPSDVSQDAVLRRKALTAFEAEKALELQSLRSRNESRVEALQETVETFTRQKQSQIERLAQGSTSAVRAQSDLEIRKRMEQDRLHRSLAYFVEPLPSPATDIPAEPSATARVIESFSAPTETKPLPSEEPRPISAAPEVPSVPAQEIQAPAAPAPMMEAETVRPEAGPGADTRPLSQTGLEMALQAAAEEARTAGWGQTAIVDDSAGDAVDALRKLREGKKTEPES